MGRATSEPQGTKMAESSISQRYRDELPRKPVVYLFKGDYWPSLLAQEQRGPRPLCFSHVPESTGKPPRE